MSNNLDAFFKKFAGKEDFAEKFFQCTSIEDAERMATENGLDISRDEIVGVMSDIHEQKMSRELSDKDLNNVSGGLEPILTSIAAGGIARWFWNGYEAWQKDWAKK